MIAATREVIYGLDVYTFSSSQQVPYQLTFDDTVNPKYTEVSLVNLLGQSDGRYCRYIRSAVGQYCYEYMSEKKATLYFNMEVSTPQGFSLLKKFVRWMELEPKIKTDLLITPVEETLFVEFKLNVNPEYLKSLKSKQPKGRRVTK